MIGMLHTRGAERSVSCCFVGRLRGRCLALSPQMDAICEPSSGGGGVSCGNWAHEAGTLGTNGRGLSSFAGEGIISIDIDEEAAAVATMLQQAGAMCCCCVRGTRDQSASASESSNICWRLRLLLLA